jgi:hypothetical protein
MRQHIENFTSYEDIKTKTINWCEKMYKGGLLTSDQFNECTSSFENMNTGILPNEMKIPQTGISRNYSLYNTKQKNISSGITDAANENNMKIMLVSYDGLTMACKNDNTIYFITNINSSNINQNELYFTLIPQNDNIFNIISPYGKYLIADQLYGATFSGNSIGNMASWKITKINTSDSKTSLNNENVILENVYFKDFNLIYDDTLENIKIKYGKSEEAKWTIIGQKQNNVSGESSNFKGEEYYILKENILNSVKEYLTSKFLLDTMIKTLNKLLTQITNNYIDIEKFIHTALLDTKRTFQLSNMDYNTRLDSINNNSNLSTEARNQLIATIPKPMGFDIDNNTIQIVKSRILTSKNKMVSGLTTHIKDLQNKYNKMKSQDINADYAKFIIGLKNDLDTVNNRIKQNNIILSRQKEIQDKLNEEYIIDNTKLQNLKSTNELADTNTNIISEFNSQNSLLVKIYPLIIFFMILIILYLGYITYNNFINNIYNKY